MLEGYASPNAERIILQKRDVVGELIMLSLKQQNKTTVFEIESIPPTSTRLV
jgi:hypothetical protein